MDTAITPQPDPIIDLLIRPIPKRLWHYTTFDGLKGIVESKGIWASDARFLNDSEELVHAKEVARDLVAQTEDIENSNGFNAHRVLDKFLSIIFGDVNFLSQPKFQMLVACFSELEDQLSQWRGYSRGSRGVSLGFDLTELQLQSLGIFRPIFAPCIYEPEEKRALLRSALGPLSKVAEQIWLKYRSAKPDASFNDFFEDDMPEGDAWNKDAKSATHQCFYHLLRILALLKNAAFKEEREWRLVVLGWPPVQNSMPKLYRPSRDAMIPFVIHPLVNDNVEVLPIKDLVIGPDAHTAAPVVVQQFLEQHKIQLVPRVSRVPYRSQTGW